MSIANYREHRKAFSALLEADCGKPILLFKGESGMGKSTLIKYCRTQIDKDINHVLIDLRTTSNFLQIFDKLAECLTSEHFDNFRERLGELNRQLNINVTGNTQAGVGNMINVELNALFENTTPEQRAERYTALTKAWAKEINNLDKPCVLLIDVYEKANSEIKQWIDGDLLNCAAKSTQMRVVIAGQNLPESLEWEHCSELKELVGVHEATEWLPVVSAMGRRTPEEPLLTYLVAMCSIFKGNPDDIVKWIKTFPPQ
ncbi:MAG: AAA family ATPase [Methylobacter sp.]